MWAEKSICTTVWKYLGIIVDIIQETNVKERILIVKQNSNVVNNTLPESELSERNHVVNRRWNCLGFEFYWPQYYQEFFIFMAPGVQINNYDIKFTCGKTTYANRFFQRMCSQVKMLIYTRWRCRYLISSIVYVNFLSCQKYLFHRVHVFCLVECENQSSFACDSIKPFDFPWNKVA